LSEKGFDPLSLNFTIYLETCASLVSDRIQKLTKQHKILFIH